LPKKQSFTKRRHQAKNLLIKVNNPFAFMGNFFIEKKVEKYIYLYIICILNLNRQI
jgi:hypothetical protein